MANSKNITNSIASPGSRYIDFFNQFWIAANANRITSIQAHVYFFLLHQANINFWPNKFSVSNVVACAILGISEKAFIEARRRLEEIGFLMIEPGITKQKSPGYTLLDYCIRVSNKGSKQVSNNAVIRGVNKVVKSGTLYKIREDKKREDKLFTDFFEKYGKNRGRGKALKAWEKLSAEDKLQAINFIPAYHGAQTEQYRKDPVNYLTQKTWNDEYKSYASRNSTGRKSAGVASLYDDIDANVAELATN